MHCCIYYKSFICFLLKKRINRSLKQEKDDERLWWNFWAKQGMMKFLPQNTVSINVSKLKFHLFTWSSLEKPYFHQNIKNFHIYTHAHSNLFAIVELISWHRHAFTPEANLILFPLMPYMSTCNHFHNNNHICVRKILSLHAYREVSKVN